MNYSIFYFFLLQDHLVCYLAGSLALGAYNGLPQEHMTMGRKLAKTCYEMYAQMETKLSPEIAYFNMMPGVKQDINVKVRTILYLGIGTETLWYQILVLNGKKYHIK